ncbi:MAG: hypothetical protein ABIK19_04180 [candidate division WOR-3 bacterium]
MAVRPANRRIDKWDAFLSGDVLSKAVGEYKPKMHEQIAAIFPQLEAVENEVKLVLAEAGTSTILNPAYLNFGREVWKMANRFSGTQLLNAVNILMNKWVGRGLDQDILEKIRNTVFALAAPTP